jgi:hypothetical protein
MIVSQSLFGFRNKTNQPGISTRKRFKNDLLMDVWSALGIFLLGSASGAVVTAVYYSAQIHSLKLLTQASLAPIVRKERKPVA